MLKNNNLPDFNPMGQITRAEEERVKGGADTIEAVNKAQYPALNFKIILFGPRRRWVNLSRKLSLSIPSQKFARHQRR